MDIIEEYTSIDTENNFEYKYRLTKSLYKGITAYGIEVQSQNSNTTNKAFNEKDSVNLISINRHNVKTLLTKLYENRVSPLHLIDIIGEYVDEHVCEFDNFTSKEVAN
ncbi:MULTISPECIES: DUF6514 family protein [Clostridium]|uniref:Uncharacterized protein n=1 Tax=Clostridium botulinum (strain Eklund 17B / Type B) TaxID=935198 RepID=B2TQY7_CLOBB|nr:MULTISPECIES: DUF6514 family protein [Clostridium]ACD24092.1 conserved hypothetical protein [Clostridium botulinum B str. Eklund 17B (NRP)]MBN1039944.1 hypothetical protein [Clostridium botulinum]MBN1046794.1 hypothetical protein [Clostridium botulinum]MBN1053472.1 hypothetical protein [Clostridium botulinum]MBN1056679.1 hypothetical protein [Clostridium botulinum]